MRRRQLLAGAAGLAGAAALGRPGGHQGADADRPGRQPGRPAVRRGGPLNLCPVAALRAATTRARADFQTARYDRLSAALPALIATATITRDQ